MSMVLVTDPLIKFEKQFPFYRMNVLHYLDAIDKIGKDKFSVIDLSNRLNTQIWSN
jgi:hypothetical protein